MDDYSVSRHGSKRVRKRSGLPKRSVEKAFKLALEKGRGANDFSGVFRAYLDNESRFYKSKPIVYGNTIYWVKGSMLTTAWEVPSRFRKYLKEK